VPGLNGEVIIVDGKAYHFPPGEELRKVDACDVLPFVMITRFKPSLHKTLSALSMAALPEALNPLLPSRQNCFLSIRLDGSFSNITYRVIAGQCKPREPLSELAKRQQSVSLENIAGTLFGFWSPAFSGGFSVAGFHLHFLSKDRARGGHVTGFTGDVNLQATAIDKYTVELPHNDEFNQEIIKGAREAELHAAEGG
jgi:alpha-acetolactate decarboxylase